MTLCTYFSMLEREDMINIHLSSQKPILSRDDAHHQRGELSHRDCPICFHCHNAHVQRFSYH